MMRDFAKKKSDLLVTVIRIVPARLMPKHVRGPLPKTTLYVIEVNRLLPLVPTFWIKARRVREDIWIDQQDGVPWRLGGSSPDGLHNRLPPLFFFTSRWGNMFGTQCR